MNAMESIAHVGRVAELVGTVFRAQDMWACHACGAAYVAAEHPTDTCDDCDAGMELQAATGPDGSVEIHVVVQEQLDGSWRQIEGNGSLVVVPAGGKNWSVEEG